MTGDLPAGSGLVAKIAGQPDVPLQVDVKVSHPDGSARHAVLSGVLPTIAAGKTITASLVPAKAGTVQPTAIRLGFATTVKATIGGVAYTVALDDLLKAGARSVWLDGPVVVEWLAAAPLKAPDGTLHPHLHARFAVRWYEQANKARIDISVENDWAFEPNPQNFAYDAELTVGGKVVYAQTALNHIHHTRWRKVYWLDGAAPALHVVQDPDYIIATGMVPNYDRTVTVTESALAGLYDGWSKAPRAPMNTGLVSPDMGMTGGRPDIGILPAWSVMYLLSQDARAAEVTLGNSDLMGSFPAHYRNKDTGRPITLKDRPYMTISGNPIDTNNPVTRQSDYFPWFDNKLNPSPNTVDTAHQPAASYYAYMATGDYYHLEELQFWANYCLFYTNPSYRGNIRGLFNSMQVRGQAWSLRTLGQVAAITPDAHPDKANFAYWLDQNLDDYINRYVGDKNNILGVIVDGAAYSYYGGNGIAPWQDHFFTWAVGHLIELGFPKAKTLMDWKSKFPIGLLTAPDYCMNDAGAYSLQIRKDDKSPVFKTLGEVAAWSFDPKILALKCNSVEQMAYRNSKRVQADGPEFKIGDIIGLASSPIGYVSNLQPAAAMVADYAGDAGKAAWKVFDGRTTKPDYSSAPQFAIIPRSVKSLPAIAPVTQAPVPAAAAPVPSVLTINAQPTATGKWVKVADENQRAKVPDDAFVRYGRQDKGWIYAKAAGDFDANNGAFKGDPAPGYVKTAEVFTPDKPATPKVEYKVGPVTRYALTRITTGSSNQGSVETIGYFNQEADANDARDALSGKKI